jgi:glycosyltransferase involved in cell wall biosynthesis
MEETFSTLSVGNQLDLNTEELAALSVGCMSRPSVTTVLRERGVRGLISAVLRKLLRVPMHETTQHIHVEDLSRDLEGIDVLGFFTADFGVGEAARNLVSALRSVDVDVSTINYTDTESRTDHFYITEDVSRHRTLLTSINADQLNVARQRFGDTFFENRYVVGQWFWELEEAPSWYASAWPLVNELWAPTRFIESMLKKSAPSHVQVRHVPLPIEQSTIDTNYTRQYFNIDDRYMFLFVFDLMSIMKRKNPLGLIEAYSKAFSENDGAQLVIKAMHGDKRRDDLNALVNAVANRCDITVIDQNFSRVETSTLISLADCYVSLHRSEGFGLTLAEAMSHGVPVIATNYSGNTDFMSERNSFLISWDRVLVGEGAGGYNPAATWAEPRLSEASDAMRFIFNNQLEGRIRGAQGRNDVLDGFSMEVAGAIMKSRLEEIWRSQRGK